MIRRINFFVLILGLSIPAIKAMEKQSLPLEVTGSQESLAKSMVLVIDLLIDSEKKITQETVDKVASLFSQPITIEPWRFLHYMSILFMKARSLKDQYKDYMKVIPFVDVETGARARARADEYKAELLPVLSVIKLFAKKADSPELQKSEFAEYYKIPDDIIKAFGFFMGKQSKQPITESTYLVLDLLTDSQKKITQETVDKVVSLFNQPITLEPQRFLGYMVALFSRARSLRSDYKQYLEAVPVLDDPDNQARARARADEYLAQLLPVLSLLRVFAKKAESPELQNYQLAEYYEIPEDIKKAFGEFNV
jgi:hypothetical protein